MQAAQHGSDHGAYAERQAAALALELGASRRGAVGAAVAFGFGTEALTYSRTFFAEPLSAFLVALAVWGLVGDGSRRRLALGALALAVLAKPQLVVVGPLLGATLALQRRSVRPLLGPSAASAAGVVAYLGFNRIRFGELLNFGGNTESVDAGRYFDPGAVVETLGVLFVSPGKGLLWGGGGRAAVVRRAGAPSPRTWLKCRRRAAE